MRNSERITANRYADQPGRDMGNMRRDIVLAVMSALIFLAVTASAFAGELTVSAAMSLKGPFEEIAREFEHAHPDVKVVLNLSSSGKLRQQVQAGAPVDVLASASSDHMDALERDGLLIPGTRVNFAGNRLVLARPKGTTLPMKISDLATASINRIAMGNPDTSPAGKYARQALQRLGLWDGMNGKLIYVDTVRQVLDYLARSEVDAGLLYATDAMARRDAVDVVATIDNALHDPVVYPIAVMKDTSNEALAREFVRFVLSDEGRRVLKAQGFLSPN